MHQLSSNLFAAIYSSFARAFLLRSFSRILNSNRASPTQKRRKKKFRRPMKNSVIACVFYLPTINEGKASTSAKAFTSDRTGRLRFGRSDRRQNKTASFLKNYEGNEKKAGRFKKKKTWKCVKERRWLEPKKKWGRRVPLRESSAQSGAEAAASWSSFPALNHFSCRKRQKEKSRLLSAGCRGS